MALVACDSAIPSPQIDPSFPRGGVSLDEVVAVARDYGRSEGPETILGIEAGQFMYLTSMPSARGENRWVWKVRMQGAYPRGHCASVREATPPPCPDVPYKTLFIDYQSGEVTVAEFGSEPG
jgi:hypothetical protein